MRNQKIEKMIRILFEKEYKKLYSPTLLPMNIYERFVHPDNHLQIVKLIAPNGQMQAMRYDSTISFIATGEQEGETRFYYDEPRFYYDFSDMKIVEEPQMGVEYLFVQGSLQSEIAFKEILTMAQEIASVICGDNYQVEISNANILEEVFGGIDLNMADEADLKHSFSRKNKRKVTEILEANSINLKMKKKLLAFMSCRGSYEEVLRDANKMQLPQKVITWIERIKSLSDTSKGEFFIDLTASDRLSYYDGDVFKIFDMTTHKEIISGGLYTFEAFNVQGCGFSIKF